MCDFLTDQGDHIFVDFAETVFGECFSCLWGDGEIWGLAINGSLHHLQYLCGVLDDLFFVFPFLKGLAVGLSAD